jgi:molybdenum cofactor cytidylyltransferase
MSIATIILAAGGSTRLGGTPKQLLTQQGQTLVEQITHHALSLKVGPVLVILGANEEQIRPWLDELPIHIVTNPGWQDGLASSLRVGLNVLSVETVDAFLVLLTDQPYVTPALLQELITTRQQTQRGIVACRYGEPGHLGVPALFNIRYKAELLKLSGDVGARKLIQQHADDCAEVLFPLAAIDLDTWQDVETWQGAAGKEQRL